MLLEVGQTNSCMIDRGELTAIDWNFHVLFWGFFFCGHLFILKAHRAPASVCFNRYFYLDMVKGCEHHIYLSTGADDCWCVSLEMTYIVNSLIRRLVVVQEYFVCNSVQSLSWVFCTTVQIWNIKLLFPFKSRPDHLSCHVKHVHSSERPFKCQVTVRNITVRTKLSSSSLLLLYLTDLWPCLLCAYRPVPLLLPPKTDSVPIWSDMKARWPVASVGRCSVRPTSPAIWRLTDRPTLTPVTKVRHTS